MKLSASQKLLAAKVGLGLALWVPAISLVYRFFTNDLGANPVETLTHVTGDWAIRILLLSLTVTPLQRYAKWRRAILFRRILGLAAFAYAMLHFAVYAVFDQELSFTETMRDVGKRPYITVGFSALVLMLPLAVTSTDAMIKRLGRQRWQKLHKLTYVIAALAVIHYWWLVKADIRLPALYGTLFMGLMLLRAGMRRRVSRSA